jgi:tRNA-Thr(GGU) m(6)t(6)A37 methyltransferase TsaA
MRWLQRLFDSLFRALGFRLPPVPREPVSLRPVGVVRNRVALPRPDGWEHVRSDIIVRDDLTPALDGIETYSHVIVVFACHLVPDEERLLRLQPRGDASASGGPEQGVLATRSQLRPNPIGVSVVQVLHRRKAVLRVRGLDAIDGTPVLDLKPYLPPYDSVPGAKLPAWVARPE